MSRLRVGLSLFLVLASWIAAAALYPSLPERVPTHWNIHGQIDGYGDKTWATFLTPALMTLMLVVLRLLPWLSPKQFEIDAFRSTYEFVVLLVVGLFAYINALLLIAARGGVVDIGRTMIGGMCLFFLLLGNVLGKVRKNFYVGVRTPWTLASDRVWVDTHRLAARLFVVAGIVGLPFCVWGGTVTSFAAPFALIMLAALAPAVYSLLHYKRLQRRGEL
jgi:uncharacterized membrane protein